MYIVEYLWHTLYATFPPISQSCTLLQSPTRGQETEEKLGKGVGCLGVVDTRNQRVITNEDDATDTYRETFVLYSETEWGRKPPNEHCAPFLTFGLSVSFRLRPCFPFSREFLFSPTTSVPWYVFDAPKKIYSFLSPRDSRPLRMADWPPSGVREKNLSENATKVSSFSLVVSKSVRFCKPLHCVTPSPLFQLCLIHYVTTIRNDEIPTGSRHVFTAK